MILVTRFRIGFPLATWWWLKKEFVLHSPSIRLFNPNSIWTTFVWVLRQSISKSFVQDTARPSFAVSLHGKGKIRTTLWRPHRERGYLRFYWFRTARDKGKWVSVFYPPNSVRNCQSSRVLNFIHLLVFQITLSLGTSSHCPSSVFRPSHKCLRVWR